MIIKKPFKNTTILLVLIFYFSILNIQLFSENQTGNSNPVQLTEEQKRKAKEKEKLKKLGKILDEAFTLLSENKITEALIKFEKVLFSVRQPDKKFPKLMEIFKPNSQQTLIPHLVKRAEEHTSNQFFKKALIIYKYLIKFNKTNPDIIEKYNKVYNKYKSILDTINQALDMEEDKPIDARDKLKKALILLSENDQGILYKSVNDRLNKLQTHLIKKVRPNNVKSAKKLLNEKSFEEAERQVLNAIRIKESQELRDLLNQIRLAKIGSRVAELIKQAEEKYVDKKFDDAIKLINQLVKEFKNNTQVLTKANELLEKYKNGKIAWNHRIEGMKYFDSEIWNQALTNLLEFKRLWPKKDREVEEKIKIAREKLKKIANIREFNAYFNQAVNLFNSKKYVESRTIFYRLKNRYPFKRKIVLEYIEKINKILNERSKYQKTLADANRLFRLGMIKYKKVAFDRNKNFEERIKVLKNAKLNFYSSRHLYTQIKRKNDIRKCNNMIEKIDERIKAIKTEENSRLREKVKKLLKDGKIYFDQQNFRSAIETFNKVLKLVPDHPEALDYLKAAREALLVKEESKLTKNHRHYIYYLSFEKRGIKFYNLAENIYRKNGNRLNSKSRLMYSKSLEQWRTILLWFPNNEKAHKYIRNIYRRIDPNAYKTFLKKYVSLIKMYLKPPRQNKERAYHILKIIQKEDRNFFNRNNLNQLLEQARPQRLVKNLSNQQKLQVRALLQKANAAFARKNDNKTIALTSQAIRINPFAKSPLMQSVRILLTQAINRKKFGTTAATSTGPPKAAFRKATALYYKAMAAYQAGNYVQTIKFCNQALRIMPGHSQSQQLKSIAQARLR